MANDIFSKIVRGELSAHKVYEDNHALAFLDINPLAKGHSLVIPKVHAETIFEFNEQLIHDFLFAVKMTMERINEVLHPDGFNVGWNHGAAGGQEVPYLHVHVIPRWEGDGGGNIHSIIQNPGEMAVDDVAALFAA